MWYILIEVLTRFYFEISFHYYFLIVYSCIIRICCITEFIVTCLKKNFSIIIYATICRYFLSHQNGTKIILYTNPFSFYLSFYPILIWKIYIMPLCLILNTIQYNNGISLWKTTLFKLYIQRVFILIRTWGRFCLVFRVCFWGIILGILHENIPKDNMQKNKNFILKILVSKNNIL